MPIDPLFRLVNAAALIAWAALILLPRWNWLRHLSLGGVVGGLCALYATLIAIYFFPAGGSFFTFTGIQQLFASPQVLLAGWVHYLAFDLFIGWWIAQRLDTRGVSRWLQAPLLVTTFMFGPMGLLLAGAVLKATGRRVADASPSPGAALHGTAA